LVPMVEVEYFRQSVQRSVSTSREPAQEIATPEVALPKPPREEEPRKTAGT
jgi:hypothetical protein